MGAGGFDLFGNAEKLFFAFNGTGTGDEYRLAAAYLVHSGGSVELEIGMCLTRDQMHMACAPTSLRVEDVWSAPELAWNGERFGLCFTAELRGEPAAFFLPVLPSGEPAGEPRPIDGGLASWCRGVVRSGSDFVLLTHDSDGWSSARRFDGEGEQIGGRTYWIGDRLSELAGDGAALVAATHDGLFSGLTGIEGTGPLPGRVAETATSLLAPGLGATLGTAGLLWTARGDGAEVRFVLADLETGALGPEAVVGVPRGGTTLLRAAGLWDGYLAVWVDVLGSSRRIVATPMRIWPGLEVEVRRDIEIGEQAEVMERPAIAHDDHVAFVAATLRDPRTGSNRVHIQLLSCHR